MEDSGWRKLEKLLRDAGWKPSDGEEGALLSPHNSLGVDPSLEDPASRQQTLSSLERHVRTIRGYQTEGESLENSELHLAEFRWTVHMIRYAYGDTARPVGQDAESQFDNRLKWESYEADPIYEARLTQESQVVGRTIVMPERLVVRLYHLARAYQLPLLSRLPCTEEERWVFPAPQPASLVRELGFLSSRVTDPLLERRVTRPLWGLASVAQHKTGCSIVIEGE